VLGLPHSNYESRDYIKELIIIKNKLSIGVTLLKLKWYLHKVAWDYPTQNKMILWIKSLHKGAYND